MKSPRVAMMQPAFLPWQGFFALAASADVFILLDDFQFSRQSWQQRNRLFVSGNRVGWVTLPVDRHTHGSEPPSIRETKPLLAHFRRKFLSTIEQTYGNAPHGSEFLDFVAAWIGQDWADLASMNIAFIEGVAGKLGIAPRFLRSSDIGSTGRRSEAVSDLLHRVNAATYLSPAGSFGYMLDDGAFPLDDIDVRFQVFEPAPYAQRHVSTFVPALSVLDALFQVGAPKTRELLGNGARPFRTWEQMLARLENGADSAPGQAQ